MGSCKNQNGVDHLSSHKLKIVRHPIFQSKSLPWLDLRVFYLRVSNVEVDDTKPANLTLNHIPLLHETILEVNGRRRSGRDYSERVPSKLRRDRIDKRSEEVTFVNTDSIKMTGSVIFEVCDGEDLLLSGMLKLCESNNGFDCEEAKRQGKMWRIQDCQSHVSSSSSTTTTSRSILKTEKYSAPEITLPTVEVYVAGCFMGNPIILAKTLHLGSPPKKVRRKMTLDSIPECDSLELSKDASQDDDASEMFEHNHRQPDYKDCCCNTSSYLTAEYLEDEDGELSLFNAGVRVGVGLGLAICIGVGLGLGLLTRTYQANSRNFKARPFSALCR